MDFLIELRHRVTGLAQCFTSKQAVADFLAGSVAPHHWEGWERLGELPAPTPAVAEAPVMADADPDHGEPEALVMGKVPDGLDLSAGSVTVIHGEPETPVHPTLATAPDGVFVEGAGLVTDEQLHAAGFDRAVSGTSVGASLPMTVESLEALPDGTLVVGGGLPIAEGSSDTYLPVDQGAQG